MTNIGTEGLRLYVDGHALPTGTPCELGLTWEGDEAVLSYRVFIGPTQPGHFTTVQVGKPNGKLHDTHLVRSQDGERGCPVAADPSNQTDPPSASGGDV